MLVFRIRTRLALVAALLCNAVQPAWASGPFDGLYQGQGEAKGDCGILTVTLTVRDNVITGSVAGAHGSPTITSGTVASDGAAHVKYAPANGFEADEKFSASWFVGKFMTFCRTRDVTGRRAQ
jgi:hypothetical protein